MSIIGTQWRDARVPYIRRVEGSPVRLFDARSVISDSGPRLLLVLVIALVAALVYLTPSASAKTVNGCVLKPNTNCAGKDLDWRLTFHGKLNGANFRNADLRGANLRKANLTGVDFRGANLSYAAIAGARLNGAKMNRARFTTASFKGANLTGANLTLASGENSDFYGATLKNAVLRNANLNNANFYGADLTGANLSGSNQPPPPPPFSNEPAKIKTNLENVNL